MMPDAEIVRAVVAGDRERFAELVRRHERGAWATAWRVLRDDHAASDAAQEAFLRAFRRLGGLRDPSQFGAWLLRIARREAVRLAKRRRLDPVVAGDGATRASPETTRLDDDGAALILAVARLPEPERAVVALYYLEGHPVAEVAALLGRPIGTVTKQLSRAIRRLRARLGRSPNDPVIT